MFKYLEHEADMGILAVGGSWPEVFSEGAKAVFNLMHETEVRSNLPAQAGSVKIKVTADSIEELFVEWLNELLAQKDINNLIFLDFDVKQIKQGGEKFELVGEAAGVDKAYYKGELKIEVKAATYAGLKCGQKDKNYLCKCIIDV